MKHAMIIAAALTALPLAAGPSAATAAAHATALRSQTCESEWGMSYGGYAPAVNIRVCREGEYRGWIQLDNRTSRRLYVCYRVHFADGGDEGGCATINAGERSAPTCSRCNGDNYSRSTAVDVSRIEFRD